MKPEKPIIIVGGGIAGVSAAEAARRQHAEIPILLLTQEAELPYFRLRLFEMIDNPKVADELTLHPKAWYDEHRITVRTRCKVICVHPDDHQIELEDGQLLDYSKLILCTGSRSFVPPIPGVDLPGIATLWTMADARHIAAQIQGRKRAVVLGGGLLGLEAAYHLQRSGLTVTIVEKGSRLLVRQLDEEGAEILIKRVRDLGIRVVLNATVVGFEPKGSSEPDEASPTTKTTAPHDPDRVASVVLAHGERLETDFVMICIGVRAAVDLIRDSGIQANPRIVTDDQMRTSQPDVFAAGDAADPAGYWFGLWSVSRQEGMIAGATAAGGNQTLNRQIPPYLIRTMGVQVAVLGETAQAETPSYELDVLADKDSCNYRKLIYRGGFFRGFILMGEKIDFAAYSKRIGRPIEEIRGALTQTEKNP